MTRLFTPIAAAALLVLLAACKQAASLSEREGAMELLARHLATQLRPKAVLVISNPYAQQGGRPAEVYQFEKASLAGLKEGFGEQIAIKNVFPELRPEAIKDPASVMIDAQTTTPLSFLVAEDAFQKLIDANRDCTVVISLIGLPIHLDKLPAWSKPGPPSFALLLPDWRMIGGPAAIAGLFKSGKLAAAIVRDGEKFSLVTAANVESLLSSQPRLFGF